MTARDKNTDTTPLFFRYDYFDEARAWNKGQVGWYIVRVKDPAQAAEVAKLVDQEFENSAAETKTEPEGAFLQGWAKQIGDITLITATILSAVFFTILLVTGNTMSQAVRERTGELGVLKAMGFTNAQVLSLVLAESCVLAVLGGGLGLGLAWLMIARGDPTGGMLPLFFFPTAGCAHRRGTERGARAVRRHLPRPRTPCACAWPMPEEDVTMSPHHRTSASTSDSLMAGPINWLSQVASVSKFGLLSIPQRRGSVAAAVFGIAGVVAVLVGVLSMGVGFQQGHDRLRLARRGHRPAQRRRQRNGQRLPAREHAHHRRRARRGPHRRRPARLGRAVRHHQPAQALDRHRRQCADARRRARRAQGARQAEARAKDACSSGARTRSSSAWAPPTSSPGLELGGKLRVGRREWPIVGIFSAGGGTAESEIWTDASVLQAAYNRGDTFQSVYVKLALARARSRSSRTR